MIIRKLQRAEWSYDDKTGEVRVVTTTGDPIEILGEVKLNKTYAYSLARFLLRVFQRQSMKHRKHPVEEIVDTDI